MQPFSNTGKKVALAVQKGDSSTVIKCLSFVVCLSGAVVAQFVAFHREYATSYEVTCYSILLTALEQSAKTSSDAETPEPTRTSTSSHSHQLPLRIPPNLAMPP